MQYRGSIRVSSAFSTLFGHVYDGIADLDRNMGTSLDWGFRTCRRGAGDDFELESSAARLESARRFGVYCGDAG